MAGSQQRTAADASSSFFMFAFPFSLRRCLRRRGGIVSRQVRHVLVGQACRDCAHRRMAAVARLVFLQCLDDIGGVLPTQPGHVIHLRERSLVARNAVAPGTSGSFAPRPRDRPRRRRAPAWRPRRRPARDISCVNYVISPLPSFNTAGNYSRRARALPSPLPLSDNRTRPRTPRASKVPIRLHRARASPVSKPLPVPALAGAGQPRHAARGRALPDSSAR